MTPPFIYDSRSLATLRAIDRGVLAARGLSSRQAEQLADLSSEMREAWPTRACAVHAGHANYPRWEGPKE